MNRGYQYGFSDSSPAMHDIAGRERKARTMVAVLADFLRRPLHELRLLNVGGSAGIIDNYLADFFSSVDSIDIDEVAIRSAINRFQKKNLVFSQGDALNLEFKDNTFDIVICSQVYEHVPAPEKMMAEIFRVLVPGGVCYFAASNRLMWNEPHYGLPLLSVLPRRLAHLYVRLARKADFYHELHYTFWGLKKLTKSFNLHDYTEIIVADPEMYGVDYMVTPGGVSHAVAKIIARKFIWLFPGYIWLLEKPGDIS